MKKENVRAAAATRAALLPAVPRSGSQSESGPRTKQGQSISRLHDSLQTILTGSRLIVLL